MTLRHMTSSFPNVAVTPKQLNPRRKYFSPLRPSNVLRAAHGRRFCLSTIGRGHAAFVWVGKFQMQRFMCRHNVLYQHVANL